MNGPIRAALAPVTGRFLLFDAPPSLVLELSRQEGISHLTSAHSRRRAARRCRERLVGEEPGLAKVAVLAASSDDGPFPRRTFDAVLCAAGLPAEEEPLAALRALRELVRPGGSLLLVTRIREGTLGGMGSLVRRALRRGSLPCNTDLTAWMLRAGTRSIRQARIPGAVIPTTLTWARVRRRPWEE